MKLVRVDVDGVARAAVLDGDTVRLGGSTILESPAGHGTGVALSSVRLLAPLVPSKVLGIGYNYRADGETTGDEAPLGTSLMFVKPPSAVIGPDEPIVRPHQVSQLLAEAELAVVIGRTCRRVDEAEAGDAILGYTCLDDVTAWDLHTADPYRQFAAAKVGDTFCSLGPAVATDVEPRDGLRMSCGVNGELRQQGSTDRYRVGPAAAVSHLSALCTLEPGDVVTLGSPPGPPVIAPGDVVEVEIEGIGILRNPVVAEVVAGA